MQIGVLKETFPGENRVAITPASMKTLKRLNLDLVVESGAGVASGISDADYTEA
ncbi:MAG: NAD(P)(+) transhydrogenase (Re/Si-specific) subunit alpha, partial [Bacteroidota bacterium]